MVLTARRKEAMGLVLAAIADLTKERGYPPTYREIGARVGKAHSAIHKQIELLSQAGLVDEDPRIARTLRVSPAGRRALREYRQSNFVPLQN